MAVSDQSASDAAVLKPLLDHPMVARAHIRSFDYGQKVGLAVVFTNETRHGFKGPPGSLGWLLSKAIAAAEGMR